MILSIQSQGPRETVVSARMRALLAKSVISFSLIWPSFQWHKLGERLSSTAYNSPEHTFKCVLYKVQHNSPRATVNELLDNFHLHHQMYVETFSIKSIPNQQIET